MNRKTQPYSFPAGFDVVADHIAFVADTIVLPALRSAHMDRKLKPNGTVVTPVDKKAEESLLDRLSSCFPGASFICEETAPEHARWERYTGIGRDNGRYALAPEGKLVLVDPLCGSMNVPHGPFGMTVGAFANGKALGVWSYDPLKRIFLFASHEVTTHTVCVSRTGGFAPARRVALPGKKLVGTSMHFFILGEHQDPLRHLTAAHERFGQAVRLFKDLKPTFSAAASTFAMLVTGTVGAAAYTNHLTPWDLFPLAYLVEKAGGSTVTLEGKHYASCGARGVVTAGSESLALRLALSYREAPHAGPA